MKRATSVFAALWLVAACSAKHGRPSETNEAGVDATIEAPDAHVDAADDAGLSDATLNDAMSSDAAIDAGPVDCNGGFEALDDSCVVDADCALVTQSACWGCSDDSVSPVLGVSRNALARFHALVLACGVPLAASDCSDLECSGFARSQVDEEISDASHGLQAAVRCEAGHCVSHRTSCGPALCDNGVLDSCYVTDSENGPVFAPTEYWSGHQPSEMCDGHDLADQTCSSVGFAGGSLACVRGSCVFDYRGCQVCNAPSDKLTACVSGVELGSLSTTPVLATRGDEVAVAWVASLANGGSQAHVTRFGSDLAQLSDVTLPPNSVSPYRLQLAAYPGGWVLAARRPIAGVDLHRFAADGTYAGIARTLDGDAAVLVARPNDVPLLLESSNGWKTHWLAADLSSIGWAGSLEDARSIVSAAWIGDGYLVAHTAFGQAFSIQRVELNAAVLSAPVTYSVSPIDPVLVYDGTSATVAYDTPANEVRLQRLANDGQPVAGSQPLPVAVPRTARVYWAGLGGDVLATLATSEGPVQVAPVDVTGALGEPIDVASSPSSLEALSVVTQGDRAIIAAHHAPSLQPSAYPLPASGWILARIDP